LAVIGNTWAALPATVRVAWRAREAELERSRRALHPPAPASRVTPSPGLASPSSTAATPDDSARAFARLALPDLLPDLPLDGPVRADPEPWSLCMHPSPKLPAVKIAHEKDTPRPLPDFATLLVFVEGPRPAPAVDPRR
jgi:hypothetical protein